MSPTVTLSLTGDQHEQLRRHLFPGGGKEAAAVALCGRRAGAGRHRLLVREVHPVPYEVCTLRTPDRIVWPTAWLDPLLERTEHDGFSLVKFHSHPSGYPKFSAADDESDRELFAGIHGWIDRDLPHASVVMMNDGSLFGRVFDASGAVSPLATIAMVGDDLLYWHGTAASTHNPFVMGRPDPPPLKWSTLSYGFALKEDRNAEEELQAGGDRRQAAAG